MSGRTPTLAEVIAAIIADDRADLHTAMPGTVKSYDPATQTADIIPGVKRTLRDAQGNKTTEELPVLPSVPIVWPGGGGYFLVCPLAPGDGVEVTFCQRDIGAWHDGKGEVVDPGDEGLHTLSGAVAKPTLRTLAKSLSNTDAGTGHMVLGKEAGPQVHITDTLVVLGAIAGAQFVALANKVDAALSAIQQAFVACVPAVPAGPDAGEPGLLSIKTALAAPFPTVAASEVKAK